MDNLVGHKVISLGLLLLTGVILKKKFVASTERSGIKTFVLNAALPAAVFLSTIEIDTAHSLLSLPLLSIGLNLLLMGIGYIAILRNPFLFDKAEAAKKRTLFLLFPSLAPGLTLYPFLEQFSGKQGLAIAALADVGNKTFVLLGLYALAAYWYQANSKDTSPNQYKWHQVASFLLFEPVNIVMVISLALAFSGLGSHIPLAMKDYVQKLAFCSTPLILFYIGLSLSLRSSELLNILRILTLRAGIGLIFSSIALTVLPAPSIEFSILFVSLPQSSCSFWPLIHATRISSGENSTQEPFFATGFAASVLAISLPFSILMLFGIFSCGNRLFQSPSLVGTAGLSLILLYFLSGKILSTFQPRRVVHRDREENSRTTPSSSAKYLFTLALPRILVMQSFAKRRAFRIINSRWAELNIRRERPKNLSVRNSWVK